MTNQRQAAILSYLNDHGKAKTGDLLSIIGNCSKMTLWRDLSKLEDAGKIVRLRGGAALPPAPPENGRREYNITWRMEENIEEKEEIGRLALDLLPPDRAYYMDAGSTVMVLTRLIQGDNYTFVTSAANIASELVQRGQHTVTMLGGQVSGVTLSCSGPQAEQTLSSINIDIAVMATSGYSRHSGFTSGYLPEAQLKKKIIQKAAGTIMLMDHTKADKSYPFTFAGLEDIDVLVGDRLMPEDFVREAADRGVLVLTPGDGRTSAERIRLCRERLRG